MIKNKLLTALKYKQINFPNKMNFAESLVYVEDDNSIVIPVNTNNDSIMKCSVYKYYLQKNNYNTNLYFKPELIFEIQGKIILGSNINNGFFYGCCTNTNEILIYNLIENRIKRIVKLNGCPNDLCIDNDKIYVVLNMNYKLFNGKLISIDINTYDIITIVDNLYAVSGINIKNNKIYVATLQNILEIDKHNPYNNIIISENEDKYMYDNIRLHNSDSLDIAVFDYKDSFLEHIVKHPYKLALMRYIYSFFLGVGYYDYTNNSRQMISTKKIKFVNISTSNKSEKVITNYTITNTFNNFDYEITQITYITKLDKYILINWKANAFIIIDKYSLQNTPEPYWKVPISTIYTMIISTFIFLFFCSLIIIYILIIIINKYKYSYKYSKVKILNRK